MLYEPMPREVNVSPLARQFVMAQRKGAGGLKMGVTARRDGQGNFGNVKRNKSMTMDGGGCD